MQDKLSNVTNNISLVTTLSHDHHAAMMMKEYEGTNITVINGYKLKTFTSTLSKKGDLVKIISQQKHLWIFREKRIINNITTIIQW